MCTDEFELAETSVACRQGEGPTAYRRQFAPDGEGGPVVVEAAGHFVNVAHETITELINAIRGALVAAGWELRGAPSASGWLYMAGWATTYAPIIWEHIPAKNDTCTCLGGCDVAVWFAPGADGCRRGCWNFAKGCSGSGDECVPCDEDGEHCNGAFTTATLAQLKEAMNGCFCDLEHFTGYCFSLQEGIWERVPGVPGFIPPSARFVPAAGAADSDISLFANALDPGPRTNGPFYQTAVGVGFAPGGPQISVGGGGYVLRSQRANGHTQYDVKISMHRTVGALSIEVTELVGGSKVEYLLRTTPISGAVTPQFRIVAGPYQLAIIDVANQADERDQFSAGGNSILITAPKTYDSTLQYCLAVIGPGQLMNDTVWDRTCSFAINGSFQTYTPSPFNAEPNSAGLAVRNFPFPQPLYTSGGRQILQNAWLMGAPDRFQDARIIGKIWDALAMSDYGGHGGQISYDKYNFAQISRRTSVGTISSLWIATGNNQKLEDLPACP
jgi:hypothetical protein